MKRFIELKRHLHLLTLPLALFFITLFTDFNYFQFGENGWVLRTCVAVGASAVLGFLVEAKQGFQGANRTWSEMVGAYQDMITCAIGGAAACIPYFVFNLGYWSSLIIVVVIVLMEFYRRKYILKKDGSK